MHPDCSDQVTPCQRTQRVKMPLAPLDLSIAAPEESDLVEALLKSLHLAKKELRLQIGLENSLKILDLEPDSVVMCLLPVGADKKDPLTHMRLLLIDAYCHEHNIPMLKLLSPEDLWMMLNLGSDDSRTLCFDEEEEEEEDDSLVLIQHSTSIHAEDAELRKFYDLAAMHYHARPVVRLRS